MLIISWMTDNNPPLPLALLVKDHGSLTCSQTELLSLWAFPLCKQRLPMHVHQRSTDTLDRQGGMRARQQWRPFNPPLTLFPSSPVSPVSPATWHVRPRCHLPTSRVQISQLKRIWGRLSKMTVTFLPALWRIEHRPVFTDYINLCFHSTIPLKKSPNTKYPNLESLPISNNSWRIKRKNFNRNIGPHSKHSAERQKKMKLWQSTFNTNTDWSKFSDPEHKRNISSKNTGQQTRHQRLTKRLNFGNNISRNLII